MEYTQIKISSQDDPKRFYRVLAVKGNPDLLTLGALIGCSINAWFEHAYLFRIKGQREAYAFDSWEDDYFLPMSKYHLSDLGDKFEYCYDTGENYDFDCKVMKRKVNSYYEDEEEADLAFVVKGAGQGIFENDHYTMWRYFDGLIDPNSNEENDEQRLPMNMEFETYGDFDKPLDLEDYEYSDFYIEELIKSWELGSELLG